MKDHEIIYESLQQQLKEAIPEKIGAPIDEKRVKRIRQGIKAMMYTVSEVKELLDYHNITDEEYAEALGRVWTRGCAPNFEYFRVDVHDAIDKVIKQREQG